MQLQDVFGDRRLEIQTQTRSSGMCAMSADALALPGCASKRSARTCLDSSVR